MAHVKTKLESISVVLGKEIPESIRKENNIMEDHFVEVRVERENPARTEVVDLGKDSPGKKFSRLLKEAKI